MSESNHFFCRIIIWVLFAVLGLSAQSSSNSRRDQWQQPERILDSLQIRGDLLIGEIGAGEGYFTLKMARRLGEGGKIYANDISEKSLKILQERSGEEGLTNIAILTGDETDPLFPVKNLDLIIMVYVFHDLTEPVKLMQNSCKYLKPGGEMIIIDRDPDRYADRGDHFLSQARLTELVRQAGYEVIRISSFLPRDNIYFCRSLPAVSN